MNDFDPHDERDRDVDSERRSEARPDPSSIVHLGINVGVQPLAGLLGALDVGGSTRSRDRKWQTVDEADRVNPGETSGRPTSGAEESVDVADEFLVGTYRTDDELVVTAELPGVDEDALAVGIDVPSDELVISADGRTIDRISLPWASTDAAKVWYNNRVLEIRLRPVEDGDDGDGDP